MDGARVSGRLKITLRSADGAVREIIAHNKVVNNGLIYLASCATQGDPRSFRQMAIGTSVQPVNPTDNNLMAEVARVTLTSTTPSGGSFMCKATFGEGVGNGDITELALILSDGNLFARAVIPAQSKSSTTSMDVEWTVTFQAS